MSEASAGRFVGQAVRRREDPRLLTGHGSYVDDVVVPGLLHAAFVRSDLAHGRITRLDVDAARALPGVRAVLTAADVNGAVGSMQPTMFQADPPPMPCAPLRPLAETDVRFVGDPIALVVAESRYVAEDACELVEVDYDPLPAVIDAETAADHVGLVHPELGSNVAVQIASPPDPELDAIFESAPHVITETLVQHRHTNVPMETRGVVAQFTPATGDLDVWLSTQNPHEARQTCARALGIPEHHVRVRAGDVGGGFGQKFFTQRDELTVIAAAHHLGRAVKWIEDRRENLIAANHARADRVTVRLALDDDAHLLGVHLDHLEDCGAYPVGGTGGIGPFMAMLFPGPYRVPKLGFRTTAVWTNTCGRGAYRGPWMMETVAREEILDLAARAVGVDPLELRRRNCVHADELPFTTAGGLVLDHVTPSETLEQAVDLIGYDAVRAEQARDGDGRLLGVGLGLYVEPTSMASGNLGVETATVRVQPSGTVTVHLGTGSHGQSVETTMAQVVAEHLGVELDDVVVVQGDTATAPFGGGTGGSRTAVVAGGAARDASLAVRDKATRIAAHLLEAAPEDLDVEAGRDQRARHPDPWGQPGRGGPGRAQRPTRAAPRPGPRPRRHGHLPGAAHHLVERVPRLHRRGRPGHRRRRDPPLRRQRGLRPDDQPDGRRGSDRRRGGARHRRGPLRALRLRRGRQPAHHDVPRLPGADQHRGADHRVRPRRDAVADPGRPQGDGGGRRDRLPTVRVQRRRRRARPPRRPPHRPAAQPQPHPRRARRHRPVAEGAPVGTVVVDLSISLDGFIAGPDDGPDRPLGRGGEALFTWMNAGGEANRVEARLAPPTAAGSWSTSG